MVVNGCLTIISGVITAHFYFSQSSIEVPHWLVKINRIKTSKTWQTEGHGVSQITHRVNSKIPNVTKTTEVGEYDDVPDNEESQKDGIIGNTGRVQLNGKEIAAMVNNIMMSICVFMTLVSMVLTAILFQVLE